MTADIIFFPRSSKTNDTAAGPKIASGFTPRGVHLTLVGDDPVADHTDWTHAWRVVGAAAPVPPGGINGCYEALQALIDTFVKTDLANKLVGVIEGNDKDGYYLTALLGFVEDREVQDVAQDVVNCWPTSAQFQGVHWVFGPFEARHLIGRIGLLGPKSSISDRPTGTL